MTIAPNVQFVKSKCRRVGLPSSLAAAGFGDLVIAFVEELLERGAPVAQQRALTVFAQDPSIEVDGHVLPAAISVPAEVLQRGPRGARFHVADYDPATGILQLPVVFGDNDPYAGEDAVDVGAPTFRA